MVRLVDLALEAADDPVWARAVPTPRADRLPDAPLLHETTLTVDGAAARRLIRALLREAHAAHSEDDGPRRKGDAVHDDRRRRLDVMSVLQAAIAQDADVIEQKAAAAGVDPARLAAVAQLAVQPLLRACAVALRDAIPETWLRGYCPVCGAWPAVAELRGLERNRRLRCGRCGTDWPIPVLRCPYCDEMHHDHLHALLPEGDEQTRRVDVCETCNGYLKAFSVLTAMSPRTLALTDLATIDLDLVAQERGYERPARAGFAVAARVTRARAGAR